MQFFSLAVVVILGFASCPAGAEVGFPDRDPVSISHTCIKRTVGTHQGTFSNIRTTDQRYFRRHVVTSLDWIESSIESKAFLDPSNADDNPYNILTQPDCAMVVSANGYNSFTYNSTHCVGYSYQASSCNVGPRFFTHNDTGIPFEIFVASNQSTSSNNSIPYVPDTAGFGWLVSTIAALKARFLIDGLYADRPVTELRCRLGNGTEVIYTRDQLTTPMTIELPIDGDCTGQDLTVVLLSFGVVVSEKVYPRDVCGDGTDTCTGCINTVGSSRSAFDDKLSYRTLEEGCKKYKGHSVPIVTSELRRDQIISYLESDTTGSPDSFWVGFSRSAGSSSFTWPDGSTDLSMFGNGKTFTPRSDEDCSTAYVDVVSMELMINSAPCVQKRSGFCVL